jgi:hypothetical protein
MEIGQLKSLCLIAQYGSVKEAGLFKLKRRR